MSIREFFSGLFEPDDAPPREEQRAPVVSDWQWGGIMVDPRDMAQHYAVLGITGSGKTHVILMLLRSALLDAASGTLKDSALIYDPKHDLLPYLVGMGIPRSEIHVLNPFDTRSRPWDIAADINDYASCLQLAQTLIPDEKQLSQPYFTDAARDILSALVRVLVAHSNRWTLNDLIEICLARNTLQHVLSSTPEGAAIYRLHCQDNSGDTSGNIISTLRTRLAPYVSIARAWARSSAPRVSLESWVSSEPKILLLGRDAKFSAALDPLNRLMFRRAADLLLSQSAEEPKRTWIVVDEARVIGKLDGLPELLLEGRSKNVHVVIGFQNISGLRAVYGEHEAEELVGQCGNKAILRLDDPVSAEWASRYFGEHEYIHTSRSESYSSGQQESRTVGTSEDLRKREAVLSQEFRLFPMTTLETGLTGAYCTPHRARIVTLAPGVTTQLFVERDRETQAYVRVQDEAPACPLTSGRWGALGFNEPPRAVDNTEPPREGRTRNRLRRPQTPQQEP